MFNPILGELVAREQYRDRLIEAEHNRLIATEMVRQPARHFDLRTWLSNRLISVRYIFKAHAHAD